MVGPHPATKTKGMYSKADSARMPPCMPLALQVQLQLQHLYKLNEFHGPVDCVRYTLRQKGFTGLYRGLSPWLAFALPRYACLHQRDAP